MSSIQQKKRKASALATGDSTDGDSSSDPDDISTLDSMWCFSKRDKWPKPIRDEIVEYIILQRRSHRQVAIHAKNVYKKTRFSFFEQLREKQVNLQNSRDCVHSVKDEFFSRAIFGVGSQVPVVDKVDDEVPDGDGLEEIEFELNTDDDYRKLWTHLVTKEAPIAYDAYAQQSSTVSLMLKRNAQAIEREVKRVQQRLQKQLNTFSATLAIRGKRAVKEMLSFWKRNEKEEREARKRAEKEVQEAAKHEEEMREAKRQQRKLNFLITQTELYSHFIGNKGAVANPSSLEKPDEAAVDFDNEDEQQLAEQARISAERALMKQRDSTKHFDEQATKLRREADGGSGDDFDFLNPSSMNADQDVQQPRMLQCELKNYQLKGLNWLASLYDQGINGILADEMGLGKTVQSISLMAHLAETHNIWGPFLVITPVSTLHNWQQEILKFAPDLKPLPYWGSQTDRRVLRQFWNRKKLYSREAPFHVLVTSYQLVVTDERYFQKVKWQYMVLDEAQAIKSSSSQRWNTLLKFNCRNRLLLTGTPIQNSMQELWNLLHFIMPTLFDSHEEFSDWFARDIESHSKDNGNLDEHQLKRLHMILKPFMLRRVKRDVQNELGEKIEVELMCPLAPRQKRMYYKLKGRISVSELLEKAKSVGSGDAMTTSLMNLYMQFRKVCNHPELFEREKIRSPFFMVSAEAVQPPIHLASNMDVPFIQKTGASPICCCMPRLLFDAATVERTSRVNFVDSVCNIWTGTSRTCSIDVQDGSIAALRLAGLASRALYHLLQRQRSWFALLGYFVSVRQRALDCSEHALLTGEKQSAGPLLVCATRDERLFVSGSAAIYELVSVVNQFRAANILADRLERAYVPRVESGGPELYCSSRRFWTFWRLRPVHLLPRYMPKHCVPLVPRVSVLRLCCDRSPRSASQSPVVVPSMQHFIAESGKLLVLDRLLPQLKAEGHRVLIYFQMTRMIDLMEEYLTFRQQTYLRLDGSTSIGQRRDMVHDFQNNRDIFIFLLSTRAGGLGINLTGADTVIFYESDWNPTVDQQAMDRAHRLGQTRQVTVYRLITQGTVEQKILVRAKQKDLIQKTVISGGDFKQQDIPSANDMVALLLDEDELEERASAARPKSLSAGQTDDASASKALDSKPFLSRGSRKSKKIPNLQDRFKLGGPGKRGRTPIAGKASDSGSRGGRGRKASTIKKS